MSIVSAADFGKVAVLMGGTSAERDVSLKSGEAVLAGLRQRDVDAHAVDPKEQSLHDIDQADYARAFIILHGRGGEDGVMQGALQSIDMPYTGSGVLGSALAMDKLRCKQLWHGMGLPTPQWHVLQSEADCQQAVDTLGLPLMVKPAHEGSSIGMSKVEQADRLVEAWRLAATYDDCVIAEQWITGSEYTAAILGNQVLPLIKLETPNSFYDFDAKYVADTTNYICPCGLDENTETHLASIAMQAFHAVGASGWGRVDFMCDENKRPYLIEVNTVPGMTDHSLVPMAARAAGIEFDELVWRILQTSEKS